MKLKFYPYGPSNSCRDLSRAVGGIRIKPNSNTYRPRYNHVIVNWGNSNTPAWSNNMTRWINSPTAVSLAANKLKTFNILAEDMAEYIPTFTTDASTAWEWADDGSVIYCRTKLCSRSGDGIKIVNPEVDDLGEFPAAPLYTKLFNAKHEYRVHVFNRHIIDIVKKSKRVDESPSRYIRNHSGGWVFIRNYESVIPSWVQDKCIEAVSILGLHFGAVDVGYNPRNDTCCIYEVNTAPGICGITLQAYRTAILSLVL